MFPFCGKIGYIVKICTKQRKKQWILAVLLFAVCFAAFPMCLNAADITTCDITLKCGTPDQSRCFSNERFFIYQIADDNENIKTPFRDIAITKDETDYIAKLRERITAETGYYADIVTGTNGEVAVTLPRGLYLIIGEKVKDIYTPAPLLIKIDSEKKLTCYVKYTTTEISPAVQKTTKDKPKTGEKKGVYVYSVSLLLSAIVFFMAAKVRWRSS